MRKNKLHYLDYHHHKHVSKQRCSSPYVREKQKAAFFPLCFTASQWESLCLSSFVSPQLFFNWLLNDCVQDSFNFHIKLLGWNWMAGKISTTKCTNYVQPSKILQFASFVWMPPFTCKTWAQFGFPQMVGNLRMFPNSSRWNHTFWRSFAYQNPHNTHTGPKSGPACTI